MITPRLVSVMPGIHVEDVPRSVEFYERYLGFAAVFRNGVTFAIVSRDGIELGIGQAAYTGSPAGSSGCYCKLSQGIDTLYAECQSRGVAILHELRDESYGMREFMIADPDGNRINFGQPIESRAAASD
jgi:catechol 2,3-dioxygenase-like lactoylglutathione lyase family enzyme